MKRYLPDDLLARHFAIRSSISVENFFRSPKHQKTQELWCAAHFSKAYEKHLEACSVLIADHDNQTDIDFELEVKGENYPFQITEVQAPSRRRGDDYKGSSNPVIHNWEWDEGTQNGVPWINNAITKKFCKYGGDVANLNLLIYLNFQARQMQYETICQEMSNVAPNFASIWLLNANTMCCIVPNKTLMFFKGWMIISESPIDENRNKLL